MRMRTLSLQGALGLAGLLATLAAPLARAEDSALSPEERGLAIAREADRHNSGWGDSSADLKMILRNKQGQESTRKLRVRSLEVEGDGDKSLTIFDEPRDVRGTALLTHSHKLDPDDQWLYLPSLKRVKRIASKNKSGPFVGSEFAFEDLGSQEVEKFSYRYLKDEPCPGAADRSCHVLERFPLDQDSGYTRQVAWLDQADYRIYRVDYYDRKESLLKTLTNSGFQLYLERYWRPMSSLMENHQTGKSTQLLWENLQFQTGLSAEDFSQTSLERIR